MKDNTVHMSIMSRKAAEYWWNLPIKGVERKSFINPPEAAYYTKDEMSGKWNIVTWSDVHKKRTEKIKATMNLKRKHEVIKPCVVWVFSNEGRFPFGGFYTIVKTLKSEYYLNFRNEGLYYSHKEKLQLKVMNCFPLCLPIPELFDKWMEEFVVKYNNPTFYKPRKIQGTAKCWCRIDENGYLVNVFNDFSSPNG